MCQALATPCATGSTDWVCQEPRTLQREIERYTAALATSDEPPESIVRAIAEREKRVVALKGELAAMKAAPNAVDMEIQCKHTLLASES